MSDIVESLLQQIGRDELDEDDQIALVPRWEVKEAADEIERLQQNLYIAQEQEKEQGQIENELRTEIEGLRGLLYEVWDAAPYLGPDIHKRVREALGAG